MYRNSPAATANDGPSDSRGSASMARRNRATTTATTPMMTNGVASSRTCVLDRLTKYPPWSLVRGPLYASPRATRCRTLRPEPVVICTVARDIGGCAPIGNQEPQAPGDQHRQG